MIPRSKISTRRHERRSAVASNFTAFSRSVSILARQSSRARRADEPELRHLFRVRGSRWRSPSRSRLVVGTTQPRRSRSARLGRLARTASKRHEKTKRNFAFSTFFRCDPRDAHVDEKRKSSAGEQSLSLCFQRARGRRMATRDAAKGARCSIRRHLARRG